MNEFETHKHEHTHDECNCNREHEHTHDECGHEHIHDECNCGMNTNTLTMNAAAAMNTNIPRNLSRIPPFLLPV